jgi:chitodextrinase
VSLSWNASNDNVGVTAYRVYRGGVLVATVAAIGGAPPATSFQDANLAVGQSFVYAVSALDADGNESPPSPSVRVDVLDTQPPSAPPSIAATANAYNQVTVQWQAATDNVAVTGYRVFRGGTQIVDVANTLSYVDPNLTEHTTYTYTVAALDSAGNVSPQSAAATVTTPFRDPVDKQAPTVPGNVQAKVGDAVVTLQWDASTDNRAVTGYQIWRRIPGRRPRTSRTHRAPRRSSSTKASSKGSGTPTRSPRSTPQGTCQRPRRPSPCRCPIRRGRRHRPT